MVKRVGKYEIGKTLGEGTFGKVKFAVNTESTEKVAIKILDKEKIQKQNMGAQIKKEISIMKMVKHENVVKLYEVLASRTKIFIVLELITGGELFDKIVAEGRFDEPTARYYFRQLIKGVKYCHGQGVCHRDLKPKNLLLDANGLLKISDFGLSALYTGSAEDEGRATLLHTTCGTPNYVAPEVLADKGYDGRAADVWSCGVILYVLLAGFLPFDEPHMSALFRKIQKADFTYPSWFTGPVRTLIDRILVPDPLKRISVGDIEADPWFIGPDNYKDDNDPFSKTGGPDGVPIKSSAPTNTSSTSNAGGKGMQHIPSAREIDEAVADLDDNDVNDEKPAAKTVTDGPRMLNAFDVVSMLGGLELSRIMETNDKRVTQASPQFLSSSPAATILMRISSALSSLGATSVTVDDRTYKVKGKVMTGRGEISVVAIVYRMSDELHLVEIHRGRGDILEYNSLHAKLRDGLGDIITKSGSSAANNRK